MTVGMAMGERTRTTDETEKVDTDRYLVDETPDLKPSIQRERDLEPDTYTTGYDPHGDTRVGIGSADGDARKLVRHNEGRHRSDGNHSTREAARDKKRITESLCSTLDVTSHQQQRAVTAMTSMNLDRLGRQKRLTKVALATIKVVVEWDRYDRLRREGNLAELDADRLPDRMLDDEQYRTLLAKQDVSRRDLFRVSQLVKRELKQRNFFRPDSGTGASTGEEAESTDKA